MNTFTTFRFTALLFGFIFTASITAGIASGDEAQENKDLQNCLCGCLEPPGGQFSCGYDTEDKGWSPSCSDLSNGPCICKAYGCFRGQLPTGGECYNKCVEKVKGGTQIVVEEKPDPNSCKDFGVNPLDFDISYDEKILRKEFLDFMKKFGSLNKIEGASDKYSGWDPVDFGKLGWFMFTTNLEEVKDSKFMTGKENDLGKRIIDRSRQLGRPLNPSEILEESMKLNNNYVFDSLLTAHNFLKQKAYDIRETRTKSWKDQYNQTKKNIEKLEIELQGKGVMDDSGMIIENEYLDEDAEKKIVLLDKFRKEAEKLETFKKNSEELFESIRKLRKIDNEGAWYHLFGTLTTGYAERENTWKWFGDSAYTRIEVWGEHRIYKGLWKWEDYDKIEYCWDVWGGYLGGEIYGSIKNNQENVKKRIIENPDIWKNSISGYEPLTIKRGFEGVKIYE